MPSPEHNPLLPVVLGNELETSVHLTFRPKVSPDINDRSEPLTRLHVIDDVLELIPDELYTGTDFLTNGFRLYDGQYKHADVEQAEIATPECATLQQVVVATRVGELILQKGVEQMLEAERDYYVAKGAQVRIHKRVADSVGNAWGCHDNFGFEPDTVRRLAPGLRDYLGQYLMTRSLISGAGMVDSNGSYLFSQKTKYTSKVSGYGFFGRHYRDASSNDEEVKRIELGSSDANVSDWTTRVRIGSAVLLFATIAAGQHFQLDNLLEELDEKQVIANGRDINVVAYDFDSGKLSLKKSQRRALALQQRVAEVFLDSVASDIDNREYPALARELYEYCDDLRAVADGRQSLALLTDRADWAAKLAAIAWRLEHDKQEGEMRWLGDLRTQADDLNYDFIGIIPKTDEGFFYDKGVGFRMRERKHFRYTVPEKLVTDMYDNPPQTRAAGRAALLRTGYPVKAVDWDTVKLDTPAGQRVYKLPDAASSEYHQYVYRP